MKNRLWKLFASALLPIVLLVLIGLMFGQFPFGDHTLLVWDMNWQYASFFSYLHEVLHGNASAFYSFSRAIGGNMTAVMGYYLMSPFNLIFYFFDAEHIYIGILLLLLLKVGSCGLAMYVFLERNGRNKCELMFSTAYALSAYVIGYWFNIMWLDSLIILPLMVWGIEKLVKKRGCMLYVVMLALGIITNFYIGYMMCAFSVMYFVCYFFMLTKEKRDYRVLLHYAGSSLLGGMLSAVVTIPVVLSMQGGRADSTSFYLLKDFSKMFDIRQLPYEFFAGAMSNHQISAGRPLLYCGLLTLLFALYWFLKKGTAECREKIGYALMLLFLLISCWFKNLYALWHGLQIPNGSPYRFSFLYIFLIVLIAYKGCVKFFQEEDHTKAGKWLGSVGALMLIVLMAEYGVFAGNLRETAWIMNGVLIIAYVLLLVFFKKRKEKCLYYLLPCVMCAELLLNANCSYLGTEEYTSASTKEYLGYLTRVEPLVEEVKRQDGFFRTVMTGDAYWSVNDPMLLQLYGLDSYTSAEEKSVLQIAKNLGYSHSVVFGIHYENGATKASEALLGVKYMISSDNPGKGYTLVDTANGLGLYENQNALPLAFGAGEEILEAESVDAEHSVFEYLNKVYHSLVSGQKKDIFCEVDSEITTANECEMQKDGTWVTADDASDPYVEYEIHIEDTGSIYAQYSDACAADAVAYINGQEVVLDDEEGFIKKLGVLDEGDEVTIRFHLAQEMPFCPENVYIYREQEGVLAQYTAEIPRQTDASMDTDSRIRIDCMNEEAQYLVCTIPYDKGWNVKVDGEKVEAVSNASNLMMIWLEAGHHEIELSYVPQGICIGGGVSAAAILICVLYCVGKRKHKCERKGVPDETVESE